jgi:hypothetical protein
LNQPLAQWLTGALFWRIKRTEWKVDHSPKSGAKFKNDWTYISTPPYIFMVWC